MTNRTKSALDVSGASLSIICLAHCLALPTAAVAAPALAPAIAEQFHLIEDRSHLFFVLLVLPITAFAFFWGEKSMRAGWRTMVFAGLGVSLLLLAATHILPHETEIPMTVTGVLILLGAHIANWRGRLRRGHDHERECGICED